MKLSYKIIAEMLSNTTSYMKDLCQVFLDENNPNNAFKLITSGNTPFGKIYKFNDNIFYKMNNSQSQPSVLMIQFYLGGKGAIKDTKTMCMLSLDLGPAVKSKVIRPMDDYVTEKADSEGEDLENLYIASISTYKFHSVRVLSAMEQEVQADFFMNMKSNRTAFVKLVVSKKNVQDDTGTYYEEIKLSNYFRMPDLLNEKIFGDDGKTMGFAL